jgi:hypothetical protein
MLLLVAYTIYVYYYGIIIDRQGGYVTITER